MTLLSIVTGFVLCLLALPLVRRGAPATGAASAFGGIAVITATAVGGVLVPGGTTGQLAAAVAAATAVGLLGLLGAARPIGWRLRAAVELAAAGAVVIAGVRLGITDVGALDLALTLLWIVAASHAFYELDARDGLASGVGAIAAAATLVLAALGAQHDLAHLAGALAAACVGVVVYGRVRPDAMRLGDSGSLFVGFIVGVAVVELDVAVKRPASLVVSLLLVGLPLLGLIAAALGRLRRGMALGERAGDTLLDRLVARGASPGRAAALLVMIQLMFAVLAVAVGRSMVNVAIAVVAAGVISLVVLALAVRAHVHDAPVEGLPRPARLAALSVVVLLGLATAAASVALLGARGPLRRGADLATTALNAARDGDYQRARVLFDQSQAEFERGRDRLSGPLPSLGLAVPVVSSNVRAARLLSDIGAELAASGGAVATEVRPERLRMQGGTVPLDEIARIAPSLRDAADAMNRAERRMKRARQPYLLGPVRDAVRLVGDKLTSVSGTAQRGAEAAELAPRILGDGSPRRYFLAIQNNAEARATGGFIGNFGELVVEDGRISLVKFGSLDDLRDGGTPFQQRTLNAPAQFTKHFEDRLPDIKSWLHVNITPDFPTVARLIESLYPQSGGQKIDGVIAVDAVGLSALLKLTGPVDVQGWPVPLTSENIVRVTTQEQYEPSLSYDERRDFLGVVAETVWRRVSSGDLGTPYTIADALGPATTGRHIQLALFEPDEDRFVRRLGIAGALPAPKSDSLLLVSHNGGGNKLDVYLGREITYRVRVEPHNDGTALVTGVVDVELRNLAPASGLAVGVLGDVNQSIKPGENLSLTSLYSPLRAAAALVDGKRYPFRSDAELSQLAHTTYLKIPPRSNQTLQMLLSGRVALVGGEYTLDLLHQPRIEGDKVTVSVEIADGWEITRARGLRRTDMHHATGTFTHDADKPLSLRLEAAGISGLWDALND